jgi:DNA-directed RNA polymerase specialized sigma24 family protein
MGVEGLAGNGPRLIQFLDAEVDALMGILRVYLLRAGLAGDDNATSELLNSVVVEALSHAQRYDPARPPRAWLLGIGANLVRRRQAEAIRLNQREALVSDLADGKQVNLGEEELFDILAAHASGSGGDVQGEFEQQDSLTTALKLLTAEERRVVQLFCRCDLNGDTLAGALHVTPGAARVRLHRALAHLRRVWQFTEEKKGHD